VAGELPVAWFMLGQKQGYMAVGSMVCESSGTDSQQEGELGGEGEEEEIISCMCFGTAAALKSFVTCDLQ